MRLFLFILTVTALQAAAANPLSIAPLSRSSPVQFESEILPFLKESCLACHNQTKAKAELVLETPQTILKGGESGPAVVPGKPDESLLLRVAAHREKPIMPPADNKVNAPDLKAEQLALLKLWIEQGAAGEVHNRERVAWQSLPKRVRPILSLAVTEDGQLAACGRGNELTIYQLPTHRTLHPLTDPALISPAAQNNNAAHYDLVQSLDFTPDGEMLASGSYREVKLWRRQHDVRAALPELRRFDDPCRLLAFSPDRSRLATVSKKMELSIWNAERKLEATTRLVEAPDFLLWNANGDKLATATASRIQIWTRELSFTREINEEQPPIVTLALARDHLMSANAACVVRTWDMDSGRQLESFTNSHPVLALALSPDRNTLAIADDNKSILIVNLSDHKVIRQLNGNYRSTYRLSHSQRALSRSTNYTAYRKSLVEKAEKERQTQVDRVRKAGEAVGVARRALGEQEVQLAAAKKEEDVAQKELAAIQSRLKEAQDKSNQASANLAKAKAAVVDLDKNALQAKLDELVSHAALVAISTNSLAVLKIETEKNEKAAQEKIKNLQKKVADADALFRRGQLTNAAADNELQFAITAAQTTFEDLAVAQNNLQLAQADQKQNEAQFAAASTAFTNSSSLSRSLAFSPDGAVLAVATDHASVDLWSAESGAALETISLPYNTSLLTFASQQQILTSDGAEIHGWDMSPRWRLERVIASANGQPAFADRVNAVRFSPDGQFLATGSGEPSRSGELKIWRVKDGSLVNDFKAAHSDAVLTLAYSPEGRYLASGAADRFAKIFEVATGKLVRVLEGHTHHVLDLAWKSDGHTLITSGADNLVKIWDAMSGEKKKGPEPFNKDVTAVAFIGDSDKAIATSADAAIRMFKDNGEKVKTFDGASGYIQAGSTTADGRFLIAGGTDGILRVWEIDNGRIIAEYLN